MSTDSSDDRSDADSVADSNSGTAPFGPRRRISLRFIAGIIVLGIVLGLVASTVLLVVSTRGQPPAMSADAFAAARERWKQHGPASYEMDIDESLGLTGKIHVAVRNGNVTEMLINDKAAAPRLWDNWSAPGLFEIIQLDLDRNSAAAAGQSQRSVVFQQAEFDPDTGLPRDYRRTELEGGQTVEWRIVNFRALN